MAKYCCFLHAVKDYSEKTLYDVCKVDGCNRQYGFPLFNYPKKIKDNESKIEYIVEKPLARGFYGATYICQKKTKFMTNKTLLKVTPKLFYQDFPNRSFENEVENHIRIAEGAEFLVNLKSAFESKIQFGEDEIDCYVVELDYIDGVTLEDYIRDDEKIDARNYAQIVIDLLNIWNELIQRHMFHNDLHEGNLMVRSLPIDKRRFDAIGPNVRLVAIDLGSSSNESMSNQNRTGDQAFISIHISNMANRLREKYVDASSSVDSEWRIIELLDEISDQLSPARQNTDIPNFNDYTKKIRGQFENAITYAPWAIDFSLSQFSEGINAQTIHSCYTPQLLVDYDDAWMKAIQISGPQIIVGMRGCGKTMLLNALDIHARIQGEEPEKETSESRIERVKNDAFIAIKASCKSLIKSKSLNNVDASYETLFWKYSIEIIRAAKHLRYVDNEIVNNNYYLSIVDGFEAVFGKRIPDENCLTENDLEKYLYLHSRQLYDADNPFKFKVQAETAFEILSGILLRISPIMKGKKVFYLLDDASTRYLSGERIKDLLKTLIFQNEFCAFKITTERQTLDLGIKSPGNEEIADEFRDYNYFDLGANVYERTKDSIRGKRFIIDILNKRKKYYKGHPKLSPEQILGDKSLISIAKTIRYNPASSAKLNSVYSGISAIRALCVGDIGDIIKLYEMILDEYSKKPEVPVAEKKQSQCFQVLCSRRMYNLENRNEKYQSYALSFAEASHEKLMESTDRIRQYSSLYVRITADEDRTGQYTTLRELIDAGIFVFSDSGTPRSKTRDTNPMLQFKLVYRKLFGLSSYIGLSNRDRFELSGDDLVKWLDNPTKETLLKNAVNASDDETDDKENYKLNISKLEKTDDESEGQLDLFHYYPRVFTTDNAQETAQRTVKCPFKVVSVSSEYLEKEEVVLITGMGFEECCVESLNRVLSHNNVSEALLIKYTITGYEDRINEMLRSHCVNDTLTINGDAINEVRDYVKKNIEKTFIVDITALTKPIIFVTIRSLMVHHAKFTIVRTRAESYFPLEEDIKDRFELVKHDNLHRQFSQIMSKLYVGESGPYDNLQLMELGREISTRPNALIGTIPPKNQRFLSLLDNSEYDCAALICLDGESYGAKLAGIAAEIARSNNENITIVKADLNNYEEFSNRLMSLYEDFYMSGMDVDLAITGTKMNAAICAVLTTCCRINQCWYVKPNEYDREHFSKGVGETDYYIITQ